MTRHEKLNLVVKLPSIIKSIAKSNEVAISNSTIDCIMNQVRYYIDNYTKNFPLDKKIPWTVDIKPILNDVYEKYGMLPSSSDYTINLILNRDKNKENIFRELIFLANDGKLLAIYHYKRITVTSKIFNNDEFSKKIHSVSQNIINEIKEHSEKE